MSGVGLGNGGTVLVPVAGVHNGVCRGDPRGEHECQCS